MPGHPNATVAAGTTGVGAFVAWLLGNVLHIDISAETAVIIGGGLTTVALFVGKNGIRNSVGRLWYGPPKEGG